MGIHQALLMTSKAEISYVTSQAQTQTGTLLYWSPPSHNAGDYLIAILWADGNGYPYYDPDSDYSPTLEGSFSQGTVLRGVIYSMLGGGGAQQLATSVSTSVRHHCHWYVFRNAVGFDVSTATTVTATAPNPPSLTAASGYSKYYFIACAASSGAYSATAAPSGYSNLIGYSNSLVSSWTAHKSSTSNVDDPGAFTGTMTTGLTMTFAAY